MGAEIVRLWVASVDFREDVVGSERLMQSIAENYRKIRNTLFKYALGNLYDFDPARRRGSLREARTDRPIHAAADRCYVRRRDPLVRGICLPQDLPAAS